MVHSEQIQWKMLRKQFEMLIKRVELQLILNGMLSDYQIRYTNFIETLAETGCLHINKFTPIDLQR